VRYETTPQFDRDYKGLRPEHKKQFRSVLGDFSKACDDFAEASAKDGGYRWPAALRVKPMKSAPGIWEMTWSFASPDGRATFEFISDQAGMMLRWRRLGDHSVYDRP
jgi:hypothetical protein